MFFQRFFDPKLAQASYIVGCQRTGDALVVDPNRDVQQYLDAAANEGLKVAHVTETHIHADFVSGARELAQRVGAQLYLSGEGGPDWLYGYSESDNATILHDGDSFAVGNIRIDAMHTPGHTPEHLSFVVTDTPAGSGPWGILTGDFVFVGDVGRPDLLEKAAGAAGTMEAGARTLFKSLQLFRALPDHLQVWPGHGAGSACGKALGAMPSTTVGYEKIGNWGVSTLDEAAFVRGVLEGQPEPPRYFATMKRINRDGPRILGAIKDPPRLAGAEIIRLIDGGEVVVDIRPAASFAQGHVPGTLSIPLKASFTTWAGWLLSYDRPIHILADDADRTREAQRDLAMIGHDDIAGTLGAEALEEWVRSGRKLGTVRAVGVAEAAELLERGAATLLDVRGLSEWEEGHAPGATHIPLGYLAERIDELPRDKPIIAHCQSGGRSAIAASLLQAHGIQEVYNLGDGFDGWRRAGLAATRDSSAAENRTFAAAQ